MRVLHLTNCYPYDEDPSYGIFVHEQVETLAALGVDCGVEFINGKRSRASYARAFARALAQRTGTGFDVVHAHHTYAGFIAQAQRRRPVVVSFLGSELDEVPRLSRWVARRADRVIVMARWMKDRLDGVDARVIPDGIDLKRFAPMDRDACRNRLGLDADELLVLFPWNPARPEKRHPLAMAAVEEASRRLRRSVRVVTLYRRPHDELPLYMNACDALLLTSAAEGSCNSVKEALACNLPVVAVDVGDTAQLVGRDACGAVGPANAAWLGLRLARALRERRRTTGRHRVAALELRAVSRQVVEIYNELVRTELRVAAPASRTSPS